jgi:dTDP-4-amino-4,6-dideoxy-D-galactose acyltransferase
MLEVLPWDSEFFGFRIGRLRAESLTPALASDAKRWCRANDVSCLYFLGAGEPTDDPEGFRMVDERVTFRWDAQLVEGTSESVRAFEPADLEQLETIARCSHRDTRFYHDPEFARERCDDLYATWIRRSCQGWADAVMVAIDQGRPAGYLTCTGNSIGLVAVAEGTRGRGLGKQLVTAAQRYLYASGAAYAEVVTQGRNQAALKLYSGRGFQVVNTKYWYHLHV